MRCLPFEIGNFQGSFILAIGMGLLSANMTLSQSTFDIEPPMHPETETMEILTSPDPSSIPTFAFVVASLTKDGQIEIARSIPVQAPLSAEATAKLTQTETVKQTYIVSVPYTELVDGKQVTKMRQEQRIREVQVKRLGKPKTGEEKPGNPGDKKADPDAPRVETVSIPYTVRVPFIVHVDGKPVTKFREEKRMRTMSVIRGKTTTTAQVSTDQYPISHIKCFGVDGRPLDEKEIKKRLSEKKPVVLIKDAKIITPYFESLLKPETIFMIRPESP